MSIKSFTTTRELGSIIPRTDNPCVPLTSDQRIERLAKRIIDFVGALVGLFVLSPLLLILGIVVRLESSGPAIFKQRRTGLRGKTFVFLKFRTMRADAEHHLPALETSNEAACGILFKMKDDPRVTRFGRLLRRTSLDELPQLFNVLKGEMSLVGPRPLQLRDSDLLKEYDPDAYTRRLSVLPGLTGAWQVGGRSNTDSARMIDLDLDYIDNWSFLLDLKILLKTFAAVFHGHGAY